MVMYNTRSQSMLAFALVVLASMSLVICSGSRKPHVVFIVADDLGWNDIGYNNPSIFTPTLDKLAREGVILNQSYVLPMCTPDRASLMSGYYAYRVGLQHKVLDHAEPAGLPLNFTLIPQRMKEHGYTTYMLGKWHLGFCKWEYTPTYRGFDHFYGFYNAAEDYFNHTTSKYLDLRNGKEVDWSKNGTYSTYMYAEKATEYIATHNKSTPMYMYLPFQSVHGVIEAPQKYLDMYTFIHDTNRRIKSAMVTAMDDAVKVVIAALERYELWDNTLLVFTTDNGGPANPNNAGNNWPLRGSKLTLWEGGTRGVGFVHGKMLEKKGYVNNEMMHVTDWYPTLLHIAGGKADSDMDGLNVWDTLNKGYPSPRKEFIYNIDEIEPTGAAIRVGDYKLIVGKAGHPDGWIPAPTIDGVWEEILPMNEYEGLLDGRLSKDNDTYLFNIKADPTERNNLAEQMPEKVAELSARLEELKQKLVPAIRPAPDPKGSDPRKFGGAWSPGWC
ncbi:arylsulfatase I-like [Saccoglossus kowalevskii]|uniref:Arylsulfatase I-like n=1 Tax=Saccoglossus kowalevskii TaxID=10224 RepID=A0ABM0GMU7_SACKO|nr:PREDICTED: arylsulfatase I-like [Saccoglossus kowalevskii]